MESEEQCPELEDLAAYADGSPLSSPDIESHLIRCRRCRTLIAMIVKSKSSIADPEKINLDEENT